MNQDEPDQQGELNRPEDGSGEGGLSKRDSRAYQSAMEAVFAIPIALGIGWWADTKLETSPWLMLVGLGLGFAAFVMRIVKMRTLVEAASSEHIDDEPS